MNRRSMITGTVAAVAAANSLPQVVAAPTEERELYLNPVSGSDVNSGAKHSPLRSLAEAANRLNRSAGDGPMTIVLAEGIYAVNETTLLKPERRTFSKEARLTLRAEILPDEQGWHLGRMPTLIHTLPLSATWNGRADPLGGAADGMLIETSHVSVRGLRILGMPIVESPQPGTIRRLYAISRLDKSLADLEISQCLFVGEETTTPNHVGIIANGNGVSVHHCVFRGLKISAVFWTPGSRGHSMHHCVCDGLYGSAVWTAGIEDDFSYHNNVVSNSNYVWTAQEGGSALADAGGASRQAASTRNSADPLRYRVLDSVFAGNRRLTGSGTGARLEYQDIDPSVLELIRTSVIEQPSAVERDSTKKGYLHPLPGSAAARLGAGLFSKPVE